MYIKEFIYLFMGGFGLVFAPYTVFSCTVRSWIPLISMDPYSLPPFYFALLFYQQVSCCNWGAIHSEVLSILVQLSNFLATFTLKLFHSSSSILTCHCQSQCRFSVHACTSCRWWPLHLQSSQTQPLLPECQEHLQVAPEPVAFLWGEGGERAWEGWIFFKPVSVTETI